VEGPNANSEPAPSVVKVETLGLLEEEEEEEERAVDVARFSSLRPVRHSPR
jgi:hypothetical protein